ncbi:MAG: hypothetical protein GF335_01450, partial [Candidatus Moranbacteria bacterium]|nr:hypothetical protein [Candidatus Moranbacteria bacterium]
MKFNAFFLILMFLLLLNVNFSKAQEYEYEISNGEILKYFNQSTKRNTLAKIDEHHFLNVFYDQSTGHVWAMILKTNTTTGKITGSSLVEIDSTDFSGLSNVDIRANNISGNYFLITYRQAGGPRAVILDIDLDSKTISKGANQVLSDSWGLYDFQDTVKIQDNYFLTIYQGANWNGFGKILQIDVGSDTITEVSTVNLGTHSKENCLLSIDGQYFLNISNRSSNGGGRILTVNEAGGTITQGSWQIFESGFFWYSAAEKIDDTHYLVSYTGVDSKGWAALLEVDTGSDSVALKNKFEFDEEKGFDNSLVKINKDYILSVFLGDDNKGWGTVLRVDTNSDTIAKASQNYMFDQDLRTESVSSIQIDENHYLVSYRGVDNTGRAIILGLNIEPPVTQFEKTPSPITIEEQANFILIKDENVVSYKYRINGGDYSNAIAVSTPINLQGLGLGDHTIEVIGVNGYGIWQKNPTQYNWQVVEHLPVHKEEASPAPSPTPSPTPTPETIEISGTLYRSTHINDDTKRGFKKEDQRQICAFTEAGTEKDCDKTNNKGKFNLDNLKPGHTYYLISSSKRPVPKSYFLKRFSYYKKKYQKTFGKDWIKKFKDGYRIKKAKHSGYPYLVKYYRKYKAKK